MDSDVAAVREALREGVEVRVSRGDAERAPVAVGSAVADSAAEIERDVTLVNEKLSDGVNERDVTLVTD